MCEFKRYYVDTLREVWGNVGWKCQIKADLRKSKIIYQGRKLFQHCALK